MGNKSFKYEMGQRLTLAESGGSECGPVIGRAEFQDCEDQYLIRYRAGDGRTVEQWWHESALTA